MAKNVKINVQKTLYFCLQLIPAVFLFFPGRIQKTPKIPGFQVWAKNIINPILGVFDHAEQRCEVSFAMHDLPAELFRVKCL